MNLFLSIAGNPKVADNYCQRTGCGFNAAPWADRCPKCGAVTEAGLRLANPGIAEADFRAEPTTGNIGHGWVRPRPDGQKARCGGPGLCPTCAREANPHLDHPLGGVRE